LERVRSWPNYENATIDGESRLGIVAGNSQLFGTFTNITSPEIREASHDTIFTVVSELYHNGYSFGDCQGGAVFVGGSDVGGITGSIFNEGTIIRTGTQTLASGDVNEAIAQDCTGTGNSFRGEDFKVARVTVTWSDTMSASHRTHSISRQAYIAKF
jgi:hypothetical protein